MTDDSSRRGQVALDCSNRNVHQVLNAMSKTTFHLLPYCTSQDDPGSPF
jgi:hypothetical protein